MRVFSWAAVALGALTALVALFPLVLGLALFVARGFPLDAEVVEDIYVVETPDRSRFDLVDRRQMDRTIVSDVKSWTVVGTRLIGRSIESGAFIVDLCARTVVERVAPGKPPYLPPFRSSGGIPPWRWVSNEELPMYFVDGDRRVQCVDGTRLPCAEGREPMNEDQIRASPDAAKCPS